MTWNIEGKRVLVTGGTTGIGRATVEELARRGAEVVFTARRPADGDDVVAGLVANGVDRGAVSHHRLDLDDLADIRRFASERRAELDQVDVLINNAGVVMTERRDTKDGFEFTFGVNHLGHFLLVNELLPLLRAAPQARIVIVASDAHKFVRGLDFDDLHASKGRFGSGRGMAVYGRSKLANMLHARELARRLSGDEITVNCLHPGAVRTRLGRDEESSRLGEIVWPLASRFFRTPEQGAATSVWAATDPSLDGVSGAYFADEKVATPKKTALDDVAAARLWSVSEEMVG